MRWDVMGWAALALLLFAAEALAPGAFMLWMGFAAALLLLAVLLLPGIPLLLQVLAFVVLSFVSIQIYRTWFRNRDRVSDQPLLNRRSEQLIGRVVALEQAIHGGRGRVKIDDAYWVVSGPELPVASLVRVVGVEGMALLVQPA
jgi:membrane protein implicated in regulation of membrane protease activity